MFVFGIGCIWAVMQFSYTEYSGISFTFDHPTIVYGVTAAVFVTISNILLLECMEHLPISLASTIYRLNTIPLVLLAFFFLGEDLSWIRVLGIAAGLLTVLLLYQPVNSINEPTNRNTTFVVLIVLASVIRALYGLFTKAGVSNGADANTMILIAALGWCIGGILQLCFREKQVVLTLDMLKFISIAGFLVFSLVWLLTTALTLGDASLIIPLSNMGFVAAFLFSLLFRLESLNPKKISAVVSAMVAIVLLTQSV